MPVSDFLHSLHCAAVAVLRLFRDELLFQELDLGYPTAPCSVFVQSRLLPITRCFSSGSPCIAMLEAECIYV
jgi:hypothetical protein